MRNFLVSFFFIFMSSFSLLAGSGKEIFDRYCTVCHAQDMASMFNAPAAHDLDAWGNRKENAFNRLINLNPDVVKSENFDKNECVINELLNSAINGTDKGMPPKGTCNECTDEDLRSVIEFMSSVN